MTLLDLFNGNWTLGQLLSEIFPLLSLAFFSGLAGYLKGFTQGLNKSLEILEQLGLTAIKLREEQDDQANS